MKFISGEITFAEIGRKCDRCNEGGARGENLVFKYEIGGEDKFFCAYCYEQVKRLGRIEKPIVTYNEPKTMNSMELLEKVAEDLKSVLDITSKEIAKIEDMLQSRKCNYEFDFPTSELIKYDSDINKKLYISWRVLPGQSRMRLCYVEKLPETCLLIKPLVECKLNIRLLLAPCIVPFMQAFTKELIKYRNEINKEIK